MKRVAFLASFDSQLKWARMMSALLGDDFISEIIVIDVRENQISDEQTAEYLQNLSYSTYRMENLVRSDYLSDFDAVFVALNGAQIERFCILFLERLEGLAEQGRTRRPLIVTGYVGVVIEGHLGGILYRRLCDLILANGASDRALFVNALAVYAGDADRRIMDFGLPLIPELKPVQPCVSPRTILFAGQPTVPSTQQERFYLLLRLVEYAHRHPDRKVIFKPRTRIGEDTFHREPHHYQKLYEKYIEVATRPANLVFDYRPITELFEEVDLLVTISSTAAIEAYATGIPFIIVADFGIRDNYGTATFAKCGSVITFSQLMNDEIAAVDERWVANMITPSLRHVEDLRSRIKPVELARQSLQPVTEYSHARSLAVTFSDEFRFARGKQQIASAQIARLLFNSTKFSPANYIEKADALEASGENGLAASLLYESLNRGDKSGRTKSKLALLLNGLGRHSEVIEILDQASLREAASHVLYREIAIAHLARNEYFSAADNIMSGLQIAPLNTKLLALLRRAVRGMVRATTRLNTDPLIPGFDGWQDREIRPLPNKDFTRYAQDALASHNFVYCVVLGNESVRRNPDSIRRVGDIMLSALLGLDRLPAALDLYFSLRLPKYGARLRADLEPAMADKIAEYRLQADTTTLAGAVPINEAESA
ncbi:hypothetical protein HB662_28085 [Roseomonas frigidaquae]|uniref:Uncharacterized protein n=1 Tax=Falsiroseomonas frigidaquae TaxID=487318 RepID=A0ABX1F8E1_9PROT|nr:DUF6716 putative glycosyltransferase [Falsiroseomonas frigidaquae]NKE48658.1 hypothetical protein [Falsiroseomonas frigidaquae]